MLANDFHDLQDDFCDVDNADDECLVSCRVSITVMTMIFKVSEMILMTIFMLTKGFSLSPG